MRIVLAMLLGAGLVTGGPCLALDRPQPEDGARPTRAGSATLAHGSDPVADAAAAIAAGNFGLIVAGAYSPIQPVGIICFTPRGRAPQVLVAHMTGDVVTPALDRAMTYARMYNGTIVDDPAYPDADLCRRRMPQDVVAPPETMLVDRGARAVAGPAHSLSEAARRDDIDAARRYLATASIDAIDGSGMTALAWAAARGHDDMIDLLLAHGASAWAGETNEDHSALYWAAATGLPAVFDRLRSAPRPSRFARWPAAYLLAAIQSNVPAIVHTILSEPHDALAPPYFGFGSTLRAADTIAPVLKEGPPVLADALLIRSLGGLAAIRLDLVRLALAAHADPNAAMPGAQGDTPLGIAAHGFNQGAEQAVNLLIGAGADVDLPSSTIPVDPKRPVWIAVGTLLLSDDHSETRARALAIVHALVAAGADLNLPNRQGKPPIWFLATPTRWAPEDVSDSPRLAALLPTLAKLGMKVNATWRGKTLLPVAERQLGHDAPLVRALRRLGAH